MSEKIPMPKAAEQFIADAKAAEYEVEVIHDSVSVTVNVKNGETTGSATWSAGNFHDAAPARLSFHTTMGRPGVRFNYGSSYSRFHGYKAHKSLRQVRGYVGLSA